MYYTQIQSGTSSFYRVNLKLIYPCHLDTSISGVTTSFYIINNDDNSASQNVFNLDSLHHTQLTNNPCIIDSINPCTSVYYFHADINNLLPNNQGYNIVYQTCCRQYGNILQTTGINYLCHIPPASSGIINSNAYFIQDTIFHICINQPFSFKVNAIDPDNDSIIYSFAYARTYSTKPEPGGPVILPTPPLPVIYYTPYASPPPLGPTVTIDAHTGFIQGTLSSPGLFLITVQADEYRNGKKISFHTKDLPLRVYDCSKLVPPKALMPASFNTCQSPTINFINNSTSLNSYFLWNFGDGDSSAQISPVHTYADTGLYIVRLISNPGYSCADTAFSKALIYPVLKVNFKYNGICSNVPTDFTNTSTSSYGIINFAQWSIQQSDSVFYTFQSNPLSTVHYTFPLGEKGYLVMLQISDTRGCSFIDSQYVNTYSTPDPLPVHDTIITMGTNFKIPYNDFGINGIASFVWSPSDGLSDPNIDTPIVTYNRDITYDVKISTSFGCTRFDSIHIKYYKGPDFYIPNAFTPNGDGLNDVFKIFPVGIKRIDGFIIYTRWGQKVFETKSTNEWDGTINNFAAPAGVYVWEVMGIDLYDKPFF